MEREFSVKLENRPGELARMTQELSKDGVNIRAISTDPGASIVRVVASDESRCRQCLQRLNAEFRYRHYIGYDREIDLPCAYDLNKGYYKSGKKRHGYKTSHTQAPLYQAVREPLEAVGQLQYGLAYPSFARLKVVVKTEH